MRLRLVHTLSLTLLAFAGVAVLALGGLSAWQLRNGFGEYLQARDVAHFERFVAILEARLARDGGADSLLAGSIDLRSLLDELNPKPTRPGGMLGPPPPRGGADAFHERVQVLAAGGAVLLGVPHLQARDAGPLVERAIHVDGHVVAVARLRPTPVARTGAEGRFLRDQYALIVGGGLGLMVLALLMAIGLARRWTRPLAAVQLATQRLAQGELTVRLPDSPTLAGRGDEIGDLMRNVNRMASGLQQLEGARRRWLADISHELRTPLTVLRGDIEALNDGVRPLQLSAIAVLHEEVLRLSRLVDDLHLLAISDLQTLPCHPVEDDAVLMMHKLFARHQRLARNAGLSLHLELPEGMTAMPVWWDAGRIEQLLTNLLDNSVRYTQAPGRIILRLERYGSNVRVIVEDSAPGVSGVDLSQLFEPLFRSDAARLSGVSGSGLGLAICKAIAHAHGAQLLASASKLGGLRLMLDVPQTDENLSYQATRSAV